MVSGERQEGNSKSRASMGTRLTRWQERGQPSCLQDNICIQSEVKRRPYTEARFAAGP